MSNSYSSVTSDELDDYPKVTQADLDRATFRVDLKPAPRKRRVTMLLDTGLVEYFKAQAGERGYQTLINETLRQAWNETSWKIGYVASFEGNAPRRDAGQRLTTGSSGRAVVARYERSGITGPPLNPGPLGGLVDAPSWINQQDEPRCSSANTLI